LNNIIKYENLFDFRINQDNLDKILKNKFDFGHIILVNFITLSEDEIEMILKWRNDESIRRWMYNNDIITDGNHKKFVENLKSDMKNYYYLCKKDDVYIGVSYFQNLDFINKRSYWGIYTRPDKKIKDAGKIILNSFFDLGFEIIKLNTIKLEVIENNEKAINFYKKNGFHFEGKLRKYVVKNSESFDVFVMGILKEEYEYIKIKLEREI
jgi:UDP-4-amino-4,6-dideoxy-N-acetyl-beta-L-altrosamine N-acetyltransferase